MTQPADILLREVTINGVATMDARLVVDGHDNAVLIARPSGQPAVISHMINPTVTNHGGVIAATDGLNTWTARVDTRCGTCGGRYELATLDPAPLLAAL